MSIKDKNPELLTKTKLKEEYGFNQKMIDELLPEPIEKVNPHYSSGSKMQLWEKETVLVVMDTEEYKSMAARKRTRSVAARKAADTKRTKTLQKALDYVSSINIPILPIEELRRRAYEEGIEYQAYKAEVRGDYDYVPSAYGDIDDETKNRWTVNYIRHELTDYDAYLSELKGNIGCGVAYQNVVESMLEKIASVYPDLAGECNNQKKRKEERQIHKRI
ncbi:hypothetical protein SAMN05421493_11811 [Pseudobutyrivibrio sp. 49]|uniref:hypothetical protein n=1 Tax=Pseudobutyrivibrio sp. 49 TaxID=1855344 RepID=UPI0008895DF4|nr:hypothetical protein [Pseudobutyrivibrio sp. 49]SDI55939.1 hypothetical protein SAMN05421493_11811 [Pseudobutyrivibrio sp. 49]